MVAILRTDHRQECDCQRHQLEAALSEPVWLVWAKQRNSKVSADLIKSGWEHSQGIVSGARDYTTKHHSMSFSKSIYVSQSFCFQFRKINPLND